MGQSTHSVINPRAHDPADLTTADLQSMTTEDLQTMLDESRRAVAADVQHIEQRISPKAQITAQVKQNPWPVLLGAFAVGFWIGR